MGQDNVLGIQATINGKMVQQGADEFVSQVNRMEQAADKFINQLAGKSRMVNGQVQSIGVAFDDVVKVISKGAAALGIAFSAQQFVTQVARTRGEFQQLEIAFNTMLGSAEKASALMAQITKTAAVTPFGLQEVAKGAKGLLAYGVEAEKVNDTLVRLGDIASGLTIPLNDLVYLYGTTLTQGRMFTQDLRQFQGRGIPLADELAKQFGVTKDRVGELVTAGKVGFAELEKAIISMTSEGGKFGGLMEAQSKSITGQWSNIRDAIDGMFNEIGKSQEGVINTALSGVSLLVENYEKVGEALASIVATYGVYKAAVITAAAVEAVKVLSLKDGLYYTLLNTKAVKALTVAQRAYNATMAISPWGLAAAGVLALAAGTYKLFTYQSELDKATNELNKEIKEEQSVIDGLFGRLRSAKKGTKEYKETKQEIINQYGEYLKGLRSEVASLKDIEAAYLAISSAARLSAQERAIADANEKADSEYNSRKENIFNKIRELFGDSKKTANFVLDAIRKDFATLGEGNISDYTETEIKKYEGIGDKILQQISYIKAYRLERDKVFQGNREEFDELGLLTMSESEINKRIESVKKLRKQMENSGKKQMLVTSSGNMIFNSLLEIDSYISALEVRSAKMKQGRKGDEKNEGDTYVEAFKKAQKRWLDANKALEAAKNKSLKEFQDAKTEYEEAKKEFEELGGETSSKKQQEKKDNEIIAAKKALNKKLLQITNDNIKSELQLESNATKKKLLEIKAEFDERKAKIKEEADELAEANKKSGVLNLNGNGLTNEQQQQINKANMLNVAMMDKSIKDLYQVPIEEYQSYTDKRLEIEKKFNEDIKLLRIAKENAEKEGNKDEVDKINRSLNEAIARKGKELMSHDLEVLKLSPEYAQAFEDLGNTSTETLEHLLKQFESVKGAAAASFSPENFREYTDIIKALTDELEARNPFEALSNAQKEMVVTSKELADAQSRLNKIQSGEKVLKSSYIDKETGKTVNVYWELEEALEAVRKAKDKDSKATNKQKKAEKEASEIVEKLANSIKEVGDTIGGTAGQCISLIGDIASFANMCMVGTTQVSQTASKAIQAVEKASVILGIISAAIQILQKVSELGNNKAFKEYEAYADKVKEINALTDAVNEYKIAVLEAQKEESNWFSTNNLKELRDYKKIQQEVYKAYKDKLSEEQAIYQNESGGGWLTGAINWAMGNLSALSPFDWWKDIWGQGGYEEGMTAAANNLRIETRKKSSGFLGSGIGAKSQKTEDLIDWLRKQGLGELFDEEGFINVELAKSVIDNYGDKLVGETEGTLQELIELKEKYDEYVSQLREYVSSMYEPLVDNFVDSLWTWFDEGKDALDSFKDYASHTFKDIVSDMLRTIVLEKVVGSFSDDISDIYEEYAKGAIDETELMKKVGDRTEGLVDSYKTQLPALQAIMEQVEAYLNQAGISLHEGSLYAQEASSKGFETMSEETGSELNGRFTALQISNEEIKAQSQQQTILQQLISSDTSLIRAEIITQSHYISEIVDIQYESVGYLAEISKNTKQLYEMNDRLGRIEENTKNM